MFLAALLHRLPRDVLGRFRLLIRPETVLRWHRDLLARRHATRSRPRRPGRPRTVRSIRLLVFRLARENPCWGYRRIHGELLVLGIRIAASTVWEILQQAGIDPAPERTSTTWASFLRSMECWVQTCRHELLDCTLIWNQRHLLHSLREFEHFYNEHRPHRTLRVAAPLRPLPEPITDPERIAHLDVRRRDRLGGTLHEYRHAA
jgi:transposase